MKVALALAFIVGVSWVASAQDITVTYTDEEAQAAINLYDLAVKAGGLQVAANALELTKKLQDAASAPVPCNPKTSSNCADGNPSAVPTTP